MHLKYHSLRIYAILETIFRASKYTATIQHISSKMLTRTKCNKIATVNEYVIQPWTPAGRIGGCSVQWVAMMMITAVGSECTNLWRGASMTGRSRSSLQRDLRAYRRVPSEQTAHTSSGSTNYAWIAATLMWQAACSRNGIERHRSPRGKIIVAIAGWVQGLAIAYKFLSNLATSQLIGGTLWSYRNAIWVGEGERL